MTKSTSELSGGSSEPTITILRELSRGREHDEANVNVAQHRQLVRLLD